MPIYMGFFDEANVCNRTLRGGVKAKGYEGWIELQSMQLGTNRAIASSSSGSTRSGTTPTVSEIVVTKLPDAASAALFRESVQGQARLVVIAFVKDGTAYKTMVINDAMISSFLTSVAGADASRDRPMETLTLNFSRITYNAQEKAPETTRQSLHQLSQPAAWDLAHARGA